MNPLEYRLKQKTEKRQSYIYYQQTDLEEKTIFQLREICIKENFFCSISNPMDKEELIHTILRQCGANERFLILRQSGVGRKAVEKALRVSRLQPQKPSFVKWCSKMTAYQGLAIGYHDEYTISYDMDFAWSNAFLVSGDGTLCAIFNILPKGEQTDALYLTKAAEITCLESDVKNYHLYCLKHKESQLLYRIYEGEETLIPDFLPVYAMPILDFQVKIPASLSLPIVLDFGTTHTAAGVFLDYPYLEQIGHSYEKTGERINTIQYAIFYDLLENGKETPLIPSVVGVHSFQHGKPKYLFGYEAIQMANSGNRGEAFCIFYNIKRWVDDYEKEEDVFDQKGHRQRVQRKTIIKAFFLYVLSTVANQYKCKIETVHISCSMRQKSQLMRLFHEILPAYAAEKEDIIDEGAATLYNTISNLMTKKLYEDGIEYKGLILDCGGGSTDLYSGSFIIEDKKPCFQVKIKTSYENGDSNFGGNTLTFRIMQLLKIAIVNSIGMGNLKSVRELLAGLNEDLSYHTKSIETETAKLEVETVYLEAERYLPTRYREYEKLSKEDYDKVKTNFYFLFSLSEAIKKEIYNHTGILQIGTGEGGLRNDYTIWIAAEKWKLSIMGAKGLEMIKSFSAIVFDIPDLQCLLAADIYCIAEQFLKDLYQREILETYSILSLTGQSCKMELFREMIKEFVPGRMIQTSRSRKNKKMDHSLKLSCVEGTIKYLRDKKLGFVQISIEQKEPALPYQISAYTHQEKEVILLHYFARQEPSGMISRNMENLTLELYLKDVHGTVRYCYLCSSSLLDYEEMEYEQIHAKYEVHIQQGDTDDIEEREVRFFLWKKSQEWSFLVVPVLRRNQRLYLGKETEFKFENEYWMKNFFDGTK